VNSGGSEDMEVGKLKNEISRLKNSMKCLEVEVENRDSKIKTLLTSCVGAPDE
jgi:hypothetical protein